MDIEVELTLEELGLNYNPLKDVVFWKEPNERPSIIELFND